MTSNNKIKSKQNEDSHIQDKNELLNKLEKLFSKRNYKIVEKIITQMVILFFYNVSILDINYNTNYK